MCYSNEILLFDNDNINTLFNTLLGYFVNYYNNTNVPDFILGSTLVSIYKLDIGVEPLTFLYNFYFQSIGSIPNSSS